MVLLAQRVGRREDAAVRVRRGARGVTAVQQRAVRGAGHDAPRVGQAFNRLVGGHASGVCAVPGCLLLCEEVAAVHLADNEALVTRERWCIRNVHSGDGLV